MSFYTISLLSGTFLVRVCTKTKCTKLWYLEQMFIDEPTSYDTDFIKWVGYSVLNTCGQLTLPKMYSSDLAKKIRHLGCCFFSLKLIIIIYLLMHLIAIYVKCCPFWSWRGVDWVPVAGCEHVQHPLVCNLTEKAFSDPDDNYFIKVTAMLEGQQSSDSLRFSPRENSKCLCVETVSM